MYSHVERLYAHTLFQFDVHLKDGAYVLLSDDNESTAWTYKEAGAKQPIYLYAEKGFEIGPVEGVKGIYL
jgi:hypothetical protein